MGGDGRTTVHVGLKCTGTTERVGRGGRGRGRIKFR